MSHQEKPAIAHDGRRRWIELSVPQLLAGALAAASAAVAASWLGVAGTVLGAVVASVVVTVSSALYARPIERSSQVIRGSLPVLPVLPDRYRERDNTSTETRVLGATAVDELDREEIRLVDADEVADSRSPRKIQWSAVAVSAVLTLIVGFGMLTAFEAVIGKSASSLTGGDGGGSTISRIVEGDSGSSTSDDKPSKPTEPAQPTDDSDQPSPSDPTPTEPTEPTPTEPTPTEPTEPTPTEPTPTEPTTSAPSVPRLEGGVAGDGAGATVATDAA
jgi:hypothetical protein